MAEAALKKQIDKEVRDDYIERNNSDARYTFETFEGEINTRSYNDLKRLELLLKIEVYIILYLHDNTVFDAVSLNRYLENSLENIVKNSREDAVKGTQNLKDSQKNITCIKESEQFLKDQTEKIKKEMEEFMKNLVIKVTEEKGDLSDVSDLLKLSEEGKLTNLYNYLTELYDKNKQIIIDTDKKSKEILENNTTNDIDIIKLSESLLETLIKLHNSGAKLYKEPRLQEKYLKGNFFSKIKGKELKLIITDPDITKITQLKQILKTQIELSKKTIDQFTTALKSAGTGIDQREYKPLNETTVANLSKRIQDSVEKLKELNNAINNLIGFFKNLIILSSNIQEKKEIHNTYVRVIELLLAKQLDEYIKSNESVNKTGGGAEQDDIAAATAAILHGSDTSPKPPKDEDDTINDIAALASITSMIDDEDEPEVTTGELEKLKEIIKNIVIDKDYTDLIKELTKPLNEDLKSIIDSLTNVNTLRLKQYKNQLEPDSDVKLIDVLKEKLIEYAKLIEDEAVTYKEADKERLLTVLQKIRAGLDDNLNESKQSVDIKHSNISNDPGFIKIMYDSGIFKPAQEGNFKVKTLKNIGIFIGSTIAVSTILVPVGIFIGYKIADTIQEQLIDFKPSPGNEISVLLYDSFILNAMFSITNSGGKTSEEPQEMSTNVNLVKTCSLTPRQVLGVKLYKFLDIQPQKPSINPFKRFFKTNCEGLPESDFKGAFTKILEEYSNKCIKEKREYQSTDKDDFVIPELEELKQLRDIAAFINSIQGTTETLKECLSNIPKVLTNDRIIKDFSFTSLKDDIDNKKDAFEEYFKTTLKPYLETMIFKGLIEYGLEQELKSTSENIKTAEEDFKTSKENDPSKNKEFLEEINKKEGGAITDINFMKVVQIDGRNLEIKPLKAIIKDKEKLKKYIAELKKLEKWLKKMEYSFKKNDGLDVLQKILDVYIKTEYPNVSDRMASLDGKFNVFGSKMGAIDEEFGDFGKDIVEKLKPNLLIKEEEKKKNPDAFKDLENKRKRVDREIYELNTAEKTIQSSLGSLSTILPSDPALINKALKLARNTFHYNKLPYEILYDPENNARKDEYTLVGGNTQFLDSFISNVENYVPVQSGGGYTVNKEATNLEHLLQRIENLEKLLEKEGGAGESPQKEQSEKPETMLNKTLENAKKKIEKIESIQKEIRGVNETLSNIESTYTNVYENLIDDTKDDNNTLPKIIQRYQNPNSTDSNLTKYQDTIIEKLKAFESGKEWIKKTTEDLRTLKDKINAIYKDILDLLKALEQTTIIKKQIDDVKIIFEGSLEPLKKEEGTRPYFEVKGILFTIEKLKTNIINNFEKYSSLTKGIAESIIKQREIVEKERIRMQEIDYRRSRGGGEDGSQLSIKQLFDFIEESLNKIDPILKNLIEINKRNADPAYVASVAEPSLFAQLYNKYIDQKTTEGNLIATYNFVEGLKASSLLPEQVLKINSTDKIIFVFVTLFIRIFAVTIVEYMIRKDLIKNITFALLAYFILYAILFGIIVLLINTDTYRMRIVFNYLNLNGNTPAILTHIMALFGMSLIIFFINTKLNPDLMKPPASNLTDQEKISLMYKFEIVSMIIWFFLLMIILLY